jgi:MerR family transcriptional regulator, heat shock protein HspR
MNGKKYSLKSFESDTQMFTLAEVADKLDVTLQTLRNYQAEGLVRPVRIHGKWMLSEKDIKWTECLRSMIHEQKLSIPGLKKLFKLLPCWMVASCPVEVHYNCPAQVDWSVPRKPHLPGNGAAQDQDEMIADGSTASNRVCCGI